MVIGNLRTLQVKTNALNASQKSVMFAFKLLLIKGVVRNVP